MSQQTQDYLERDMQRARGAEGSYLLAGVALATVTSLVNIIPMSIHAGENIGAKVGGSILGVAVVAEWLAMLACEWKHRHRRDRRLWYRRTGWSAQALLIVIVFALTAHLHPHKWSTPLLVAAFNGVAAAAWHVWIRTNALTSEQQAELDRMIEEYESTMVPVVIERHRTNEFEAAAAAYRLPAAPVRGVFPILPVDWKIASGRHEPKVYFIVHGNRIKIGTTVDIRKRVRALSLRMDNVALLLPGGADVERGYHSKFADLRIGDTEWFAAEPELVNFIATRQPWEQ